MPFCSAGVCSQNNLFPTSLLFAGTISASLDGFSSGFLVSSCIKADRLPKLRIFLPQGLLFVGACQKCTNMIYRKLMIIGSNVTAGWQLVPQGNSVCVGAFGKMSGSHCRRFRPSPHPLPLLLILPLFAVFLPFASVWKKKGNGCYAGYKYCNRRYRHTNYINFTFTVNHLN